MTYNSLCHSESLLRSIWEKWNPYLRFWAQQISIIRRPANKGTPPGPSTARAYCIQEFPADFWQILLDKVELTTDDWFL